MLEAILTGKNVLVLSDKKEALDVVEEKLTKVLNEVRIGSDFQNPILRLGKAGNTYGMSEQGAGAWRNGVEISSASDRVRDWVPSLGVFDCLCSVLAQCGHSTPPGSAADDDVP